MKRALNYLPAAGLTLVAAGYLFGAIRSDWSALAQGLMYAGAAALVISLFWYWEGIQKSLHRRSVRYGSAAGLMVVILVGILALVNFLGYRHSKRFDLTENQLFSLSEQSKKIAAGLTQDVTVVGFNKGPWPSFTDLMEEYRAASKRVHHQLIDPQADPAKAREMGVQKFGDIIVSAGTRTERVETPTEEPITNALIKVTREKSKLLQFLTGHGERDTNSTEGTGFATARQKLESQNYQIGTLALAKEKFVPPDSAAVIIAGPKFALLAPEVEALQKFTDAGGEVMILADPEARLDLESYLKPKGLQLDDNVVLDVSGIGQLFGMGPAAPLVTEYEAHPITQGLERTMVFFPTARSLEVVPATEEGFTAQVFLKTNASSWGETALSAGGPAKFDVGKDREGPLNLAAASEKRIDDANQARVVVIGDSDFATNAFFGEQRNGDLFLNAVSWMVGDADLVAVRPRDPKARRITMSVPQANLLFYVAVILIPGMALVAGVGVWWNRRG